MLAWVISFGTSVLQAADATPPPFVTGTLRPFLQQHCLSCHATATSKGGLDLEKLSTDFREPAAFASWVKVHDRLEAGQMPPKARKQRPDKAEVEAVVKGLEAALTAADRARRSGTGRADLRRLNRTEYENTLRDLLNLPGLQVKDLLPEDGQAFGFDKSAAGLELSYVQLAKYMEAADAALDVAIAPHAARPALCKEHIPAGGNHAIAVHTLVGMSVFLKDFKYDDSIMPILKEALTGKDPERKRLVKELTAHPYPHSMGVLVPEGVGDFKASFPYTVVYEGRYKIRMSVWSFLWDKGAVKPNPRTEAAALIAEGRTLGYFDAPSLKPTVTEIEVWLKPMTSPRDEIQFVASSLAPVYTGLGNLTQYVGPGIALDWLEVEGPLLDQWPPASHQRLFGDLPFAPLPPAPKKPKKKADEAVSDGHIPERPAENTLLHQTRGHERPFITNLSDLPKTIAFSTVASKAPEADARRLLADFLKRAFRRPVAADEVQRYVELVKARLADGDLFEMAMRTAYKAALCSPDFLLLKEPAGALDDWALASRLSYFLWDSMPDDELFALAERGKLHEPAVLRAQVERLLQDPKAERFIADFTDQWLDLQDIDLTTPDKKLYPEFRRILRDAMVAETRAFFRELVDRDLSATNVVQSDFAMLNQRLAQHYGIPNVAGSAIRRVPLPPDPGRGGFLTQASVLKVTANGTVTSPVKRGAWVLRKILGTPPDPPPPNVPALEPDVRGTTTIREMLAKHRASASCAACHAKIDPLGFALENYDVIGGRQTRYRSLSGEGDVPDKSETFFGRRVAYTWGQKVDPAGTLTDGRSYATMEEFRKVLLDDPRGLARNLVGQLVVYATGAPVEFADRAAVNEVLDKTADRKYGIRSLIHEIVESPLFLGK